MRAKPEWSGIDGARTEPGPEGEILEQPKPAKTDVPDEGRPSLLEVALSSPPRRIEGILVGRLLWNGGDIRVTFPGCPSPEGLPALTMVPVQPSDEGTEVALMFQQGDPSRPCVLGRMEPVATDAPNATPPTAASAHGSSSVEVGRDGDRLVLRAEREIVLECGEASITLTRAGKVLIRGAYVIAASTGVHRILGATVEIN